MKKSKTPCWSCRTPLMEVKGKLSYKLFIDPIGNKHMVHNSCLANCEDEAKQNRVVQATGDPDPLVGGTYYHSGINDD